MNRREFLRDGFISALWLLVPQKADPKLKDECREALEDAQEARAIIDEMRGTEIIINVSTNFVE